MYIEVFWKHTAICSASWELSGVKLLTDFAHYSFLIGGAFFAVSWVM